MPAAGPAELRVAQTADGSWRAVVGGQSLEASDGELQAFGVPATAAVGDSVQVEFDGSARVRWLWIQVIALIVVVVLALPGRRRSLDDVADGGLDEDAEVTS